MENKKNILTGERPTGRLHLGHYFGALKRRVELQEDYNTYIIIADVQALTDNFDNPEKVRKNIREVVLDNLAVGIDPEKSTIFIQSMIPEIAELTVYYSNLVTVSRLYRNPTVKTEIKQKKDVFGNEGESVTYGFLGYPVSQAGDITAFDGALVPVGADQIPVIEQTKEIVRKFNKIYGPTLVEPQHLLSENSRIKGLDGNEKMGKSLNNAIFLSDDYETISKKIMGAITDTNKIKKNDPGNPDNCMVYYYHKLVNKDNVKTVNVECRAGTRGCVDCKKELIESMMKFLKPIQERRKYYEERPEVVDEILKKGTEKAGKKAKEVMKRVRQNMKIDYFD
ncbi:MAG TPA: tryptophan--tRNA ligase [Mollicutes bacterium]|jgi:tryptophanyl-tRNA synthetase|nr:tryptophan--tRNA ligase [Mollicutes bacterium]